jgi:hypothetical protein
MLSNPARPMTPPLAAADHTISRERCMYSNRWADCQSIRKLIAPPYQQAPGRKPTNRLPSHGQQFGLTRMPSGS